MSEHWTQVLSEDGIYWWNPLTNETTDIDVPKPSAAPRKGRNVVVLFQGGELTYEMSDNSTVYDLMIEIYKQFGIYPINQRLMLNETEMDTRTPLSEYDFNTTNKKIIMFEETESPPHRRLNESERKRLEWKVSTGAGIINIYIDSLYDVINLKVEIGNKTGINPLNIRLMHNGIEMVDTRHLMTYDQNVIIDLEIVPSRSGGRKTRRRRVRKTRRRRQRTRSRK
jgi:hypothetical protein